MNVHKITTTTTYKYDDESENIIEKSVVEEAEIPEFEQVELEDGIALDTEATIKKETTPLGIIFGIAGVLSIIATSISIAKALRK